MKSSWRGVELLALIPDDGLFDSLGHFNKLRTTVGFSLSSTLFFNPQLNTIICSALYRTLWEKQIKMTGNLLSRKEPCKRAVSVVCTQNISKNEMCPIRHSNKLNRRKYLPWMKESGKDSRSILPGRIPVWTCCPFSNQSLFQKCPDLYNKHVQSFHEGSVI